VFIDIYVYVSLV